MRRCGRGPPEQGEGRTSEVSASALLDAPLGTERTERDDAADFLRAELAEGQRPAKEIIAAAVEAGHHRRTVERAKAELGIKSQRIGGAAGTGRWEWSLNPATPNTATPISPTGGLSVDGSSKPSMTASNSYDRHESDMAAIAVNGHATDNERRVLEAAQELVDNGEAWDG